MLAAQSLVVTIHNLPQSGNRIQVLCEQNGTLVYQTFFDYSHGASTLTKAISLPPTTNYQIRAVALKGSGFLPLILASGQSDTVSDGQQQITITLSAPRAALFQRESNRMSQTVVFQYADDGGVVSAGDPATLWCANQDVKVNTAGTQTIAPIRVDANGQLFAVFAVPNSQGTPYCHAGYYSRHLTGSGQVPLFVYPELTSGGSRITLGDTGGRGAMATRTPNAEAISTSPSGTGPTVSSPQSTVRSGKNGHLERVSTSKQQ